MPDALKPQLTAARLLGTGDPKRKAFVDLVDEYDTHLGNALGDAFKKVPDWKIELYNKKLATGVEVKLNEKKIYISDSITPEDQVTGFIFELGNAGSFAKYKPIDDDFKAGKSAPRVAGRKKAEVEADVTLGYLVHLKGLKDAGVVFANGGEAKKAIDHADNKAYFAAPSAAAAAAYKKKFAEGPHAVAGDAVAKLPSEDMYAFELFQNNTTGILAKVAGAAFTTAAANVDKIMAPLKADLPAKDRVGAYGFALEYIAAQKAKDSKNALKDVAAVKANWGISDAMVAAGPLGAAHKKRIEDAYKKTAWVV